MQGDGKPVWGDDIDLGDIPILDDDDDDEYDYDHQPGPSSFVSSAPAPAASALIQPEKKSKKQLKKEARKKAKAEAAGGGAEDGVDIEMMDADAPIPEEGFGEGEEDGDEWDGTEEMRKRKLDEYMNELYGLEFNDIVRLSLLFPFVLFPFNFTSCRPQAFLPDSNTPQFKNPGLPYRQRISSWPPTPS